MNTSSFLFKRLWSCAPTPLSDRLERVAVRIIHAQHDEIIIETRDKTADHAQAIVKESMEVAFKRIVPEAPFVAEVRMADSWG
jgi:DNA polymerase I-like protein with 3'-5' exonuclease and polymerase domains